LSISVYRPHLKHVGQPGLKRNVVSVLAFEAGYVVTEDGFHVLQEALHLPLPVWLRPWLRITWIT